MVNVPLEDGFEGPMQRRMRIEGPDGSSRLVIPRFWDDASSHVPACHMASDCGAVGRPGAKFLIYSHGVRGTHRGDLAHNIISKKTSAENGVGLTIIRLEYKAFLALREGPFRPGGANHGLLQGLSTEFFKRCDHNTVIFVEAFDDIVRSMGWGAVDHGSDRHRKEVFE